MGWFGRWGLILVAKDIYLENLDTAGNARHPPPRSRGRTTLNILFTRNQNVENWSRSGPIERRFGPEWSGKLICSWMREMRRFNEEQSVGRYHV